MPLKPRKISKLGIMIKIHLLIYALLAIIFSINYLKKKDVTTPLKDLGLVPTEETSTARKARIVTGNK